MKKLRVLVACEESQTVTSSFRELSHDAFSCDIKPCSGGHPEWHILGNALNQLDKDWDLIIAHPPCTYLSIASAVRLYPSASKLDPVRYSHLLLARDFFLKFYNCSCKYVAIENPYPLAAADLPPYNQVVQPYEFGHPYSKATCLWLKNLPPLISTLYVSKHRSFVFSVHGSEKRSKFFKGIADAMALQWSDFILNDNL